LWCPGDALKGFEGMTSDQKCFVKAQWGVHGRFSPCPNKFNRRRGVGLPFGWLLVLMTQEVR
jgi:hypothetical protein